MDDVSIVCDFGLEQQIRHWIGLLSGELVSVDYAKQVTMLVSVPVDQTDEFVAQLESVKCAFKVLD